MVVLAKIQHISTYVSQLRSQTGFYIGYIPYYLADASSASDFWEQMKNDEAVYTALNTLCFMTIGEYFEIEIFENVHPKVKTIVENILNAIESFSDARKSLLYGSILMGLSLAKKDWRKDVFPVFPETAFSIPYRIREIDRRRLRIERNTENRNEAYWTLWTPEFDQYKILEDRKKNPNIEGGAGLQDYVWFFNEREELEPYGRGLGSVLFRLLSVKSKLIQYWADLCETWYKPWVTAEIDALVGAVNAAIGSGFESFDSRVKEYLDILDKMRARQVLVHPKGDEIKLHEFGSIGENVIEKFLTYIDGKIQLAILGAELTTSAPSVGSYAIGQIHRGVTQSIVSYHRHRLEDIIQRDIIEDFLFRNRYNFLQEGILIPKIGEVKIKLLVESEEKRDDAVGAMGAQATARDTSAADKVII